MRFMVIVKATQELEAGTLPAQQLLQDMGKFNQQLMDAGVMVSGDGIKPTSKGVRVAFSGKDRTVTKGPFPFTDEMLSGFWIWNVKSLDEAIEWVKRCPNPMPGPSTIEIRPMYEMEDFA